MSRAARLQPAVSQQERAVVAAARKLREALETQQATHTRLEQLQRYQAEYQADLRSRQGDADLRLDIVRCYRSLLDQLDAAITQQWQRLATVDADVSKRQQDWQAERARLQALQQTQERLQQAEDKRRERLEQREQDDRPRRLGSWPPR